MTHRQLSGGRRVGMAIALVIVGAVLVAPAASAASGTAVAAVTPSQPGAGTTSSYLFTLFPTSGQISSFNLTAATGWTIVAVDSAPGVTFSSTQIQGRGVTATASSPLTVGFTAQAPCAPTTSSWTVAAKTGGNFTGSSFAVDATGLTTTLSGTCVAFFDTGRGPADAAFNGGTTSQNITSVPYTPSGADMQVKVLDAARQPRPGITITLDLSANPTTASLKQSGASVTAVSDSAGVATFHGTSAAPITINKTGLNYAITPTATGVVGTESDAFNVFQEGTPCSGSCLAHGSDKNIKASVSALTQSGELGVTVQELALDCTVPGGYVYQPLSTSVIAWKYTGTGAQTVVAFVPKSLVQTILNRGSAHIDVCFHADNGKTFFDKFTDPATGAPVSTGLLPDCDSKITTNCIVSETAGGGGGRIVTFTVEDGKGRI